MLKYKTMVGATGFEPALLRLRVKPYKTVKFLNYFCVAKRRPLKLLEDERRKKRALLSMEIERSRFLYVELRELG